MNENIKRDVAAALFAAMTAIFTQLIIPIQPVPITLGTMAVMMAGAVLGAHYGALSMIIYVLLGAAGLPVFAMGARRRGCPHRTGRRIYSGIYPDGVCRGMVYGSVGAFFPGADPGDDRWMPHGLCVRRGVVHGADRRGHVVGDGDVHVPFSAGRCGESAPRRIFGQPVQKIHPFLNEEKSRKRLFSFAGI